MDEEAAEALIDDIWVALEHASVPVKLTITRLVRQYGVVCAEAALKDLRRDLTGITEPSLKGIRGSQQ